MGENGKSFFLVEIMAVLDDVTAKRKETRRHLRRLCKGTQTRDRQEIGIGNCCWKLDWEVEATTG